MNLGLCIANLLRQHPEVSIPGLGIFRKTPVAATFDAGSQTFSAPGSRIELVHGPSETSLLIDYVCAQQQVDHETAARILHEAVQAVVIAARRNGRVLLSGLGYLVAHGGVLSFEQFSAVGLTLPKVKAQVAEAVAPVQVERPVKEESSVETDRRAEPEVPVVEGPSVEATVPAETETPLAEEDISEETGSAVEELVEEEQRSNRSGWWIAAAVVLLVGAGGWFYRQTTGQHPITQITKTPEPTADTSLSGAFVADTVVANVTAPDTVVAEMPAPVAAKPAVTYEIIVGSFATMRQADKYVAEMKAKGYKLKALDSKMPGNRKKISWGTYATEEEAYRDLVKVQRDFEPTAWVAKVNNE